MLSVIELEGFGGRSVGELSGGERQRVALARALAPEPDLLLLDEPLSALDAGLRRNLRRLIRRIQQTTGTTTLYVTHDQEEALSLSDRIAVLRDGVLEQVGDPSALYRKPTNRWVAEFLGRANCIPGRIVGQTRGGLLAETPLGRMEISKRDPPMNARPAEPGDEVVLFFRPEWCFLADDAHTSNSVTGSVKLCEYNGRGTEVTLDVGGAQLVAWLFDRAPMPHGSTVTVTVPPDRIRLL